jgi:hypothetical protein
MFHKTIDEQVAEDTCSAHNAFCCASCFDVTPIELIPVTNIADELRLRRAMLDTIETLLESANIELDRRKALVDEALRCYRAGHTYSGDAKMRESRYHQLRGRELYEMVCEKRAIYEARWPERGATAIVEVG